MMENKGLVGRLGASIAALMFVVPLLAACGGETPTSTPAASAPTNTVAAAAQPTNTVAAAAATDTPVAMASTPTEAMAASTATTSTGAATGQKIKVGLVTDVGKVNDGTFNQFAYEGLQRAKTDLGLDTSFIETQAQVDYEKNMDQFSSQNYDMIVAVGFLMGDALK